MWTEVQGRAMYARVRRGPGTRGTPIVLVHGVGVSSRYWLPTAAALPADRPVYAPDLPGFGLSDKPRAVLDIRQLAAALLAWMDATGLERAIVVANSLGCQVATALAIAAPERVEKLVLIGPTVDPRWRSYLSQIPRWLLLLFREPLRLLPLLLVDYLRCGLRRFVVSGRHAFAYGLEAQAPRVRVPTLVVRGEHDTFVSPPWAAQLAGAFPHGELLTLAGAAHAPHFSAPRATAAIVEAFADGRALPRAPEVLDAAGVPALA